jgi:Ni/Fe-hydrogenase subunit HybB-like protein
MPSGVAEPIAGPYLAAGETYESIAGQVAGIVFHPPARHRWWLAFLASLGLVGLFAAALGVLFYQGTGIWGNNVPVTWALDIVSYDWWIGIASGGLLVSSVLLLLDQEYRGALNRAAETTAVVAAVAAAAYPIIHLGRPWFFYWNLPYPNSFALWPQFRSPLVWDAMAIVSYLLISVAFWYVGMLPDLATLRDRPGPLLRRQLYGILALGWRGSASQWLRWQQAYRIIAVLALVVVMSLQAGAAVMFSGSLEPGWHDTLLPVAFVAGAAFSGVAATAIIAVVLRFVYPLQPIITDAHLDVVARVLLALGLANIYCYAAEFFTAALGGDRYDVSLLLRRFSGPGAWSFWLIVACALLPVQLFWIGTLRRNPAALFAVGLLVLVGLWADRFMIIVMTLREDFLPSSQHPYASTFWGIATYAGSIGLFLAVLLVFMRTLPAVSIVGTRRLSPQVVPREAALQAGHA